MFIKLITNGFIEIKHQSAKINGTVFINENSIVSIVEQSFNGLTKFVVYLSNNDKYIIQVSLLNNNEDGYIEHLLRVRKILGLPYSKR